MFHAARFITVMSTLLVVALSGCSVSKESNDFGPDAFEINGIMRFVDVEGGCWQFKSDDGSAYQLSGDNISKLFREDIRAKLIVRELHDVATVCMMGKIVRVLQIVELTD